MEASSSWNKPRSQAAKKKKWGEQDDAGKMAALTSSESDTEAERQRTEAQGQGPLAQVGTVFSPQAAQGSQDPVGPGQDGQDAQVDGRFPYEGRCTDDEATNK